jgi:hypothetical protein
MANSTIGKGLYKRLWGVGHYVSPKERLYKISKILSTMPRLETKELPE